MLLCTRLDDYRTRTREWGSNLVSIIHKSIRPARSSHISEKLPPAILFPIPDTGKSKFVLMCVVFLGLRWRKIKIDWRKRSGQTWKGVVVWARNMGVNWGDVGDLGLAEAWLLGLYPPVSAVWPRCCLISVSCLHQIRQHQRTGYENLIYVKTGSTEHFM